MDGGMTAGKAKAGRSQGPALSEEQAKAVKRRWQQRLAGEWLDGSCHLVEVAARHGLSVSEAMQSVAWGLLGLGEVSVDDMLRHGFLKVEKTELGVGRP